MTKKSFIISSSGLNAIVFSPNDGSDNFKFIFGDKEVNMNTYLADFISPRVSQMHNIDPLVNFINIYDYIEGNKEISSIFNDSKVLDNFKYISKGQMIEIDEEMSYKLQYLSILIDNKELFNAMNKLYPIECNNSNFDKIILYLQYFPKFECQALLDNISSNFHLIDENKLLKFPHQFLYSVLSSNKLKLKSEDSLIKFINKILSYEM